MRSLTRLLLCAVLGAAPFAARAATFKPYTDTTFAAAEKADAPMLIDIAAPWCPTCQAQKKIIRHLATSPAFRHLLILHVSFDHQKDVVRAFGATMQSTLIAMHGRHLRAASVGETGTKAIAALLDKAMR